MHCAPVFPPSRPSPQSLRCVALLCVGGVGGRGVPAEHGSAVHPPPILAGGLGGYPNSTSPASASHVYWNSRPPPPPSSSVRRRRLSTPPANHRPDQCSARSLGSPSLSPCSRSPRSCKPRGRRTSRVGRMTGRVVASPRGSRATAANSRARRTASSLARTLLARPAATGENPCRGPRRYGFRDVFFFCSPAS